MTPYNVELDTSRRFLHLAMRGYWDQPTFDAFALEFERAVLRMQALGGLEYTIVDGREFAVQARDIAEQFGALIARHKHRLARKTANIVPAQLNRLQAERAGGDLAARSFTDLDEARAWLFGPDNRAA